jgi:hypothetical protein
MLYRSWGEAVHVQELVKKCVCVCVRGGGATPFVHVLYFVAGGVQV